MFHTRWFVLVAAAFLLFQMPQNPALASGRVHRQISVADGARSTPLGVPIRVGAVVKWITMDPDAPTVVSDAFFTAAGHNGTDQLLPGTDSNNGRPGTFSLRFRRPGTFVFYCRFHA